MGFAASRTNYFYGHDNIAAPAGLRRLAGSLKPDLHSVIGTGRDSCEIRFVDTEFIIDVSVFNILILDVDLLAAAKARF